MSGWPIIPEWKLRQLAERAEQLGVVDALRKDVVADRIVGFGFGLKTRGHLSTGEPAVIVVLHTKRPLHEVPDDEHWTRERVGGLQIDVAEFRTSWAPSPSRARLLEGDDGSIFADPVRPAPGGVSVGHAWGHTGTLGCWARGKDGKRYLLSNSHVIARCGDAAVGDQILQPGPADVGRVDLDMVAELARWVPFKPMPTGQGDVAELWKSANHMDAAVGSDSGPDGVEVTTDQVLGGGTLQSWRSLVDVPAGLQVAKHGAATGYSTGHVVGHYGCVKLTMPGFAAPLLFENQIMTTDIANPGDSGSLVYDPIHKSVVGLLYASGRDFSWVNPIEPVHAALEIETAPKQWRGEPEDPTLPPPERAPSLDEGPSAAQAMK